MRNVFIMGCGRSGTSLAAGILGKAGYFMGNRLTSPNETNPKGQFEDGEVNTINEELLAGIVPGKPKGILGRILFRSRPGFGQRWLAEVSVRERVKPSALMGQRISELTSRQPYCFKDPRFSYTLPAWRPFVRNAVFVCVFRDPASTGKSITRQAGRVPHLKDLCVTFEKSLRVWMLMYRHILEIHRNEGEWLFLHFNQLVGGGGVDRIESATGALVDRSFPDPKLRQSFSDAEVPDQTMRVYSTLCELAQYDERSE